MSYVVTISLRAQPLGQMAYGFLFDTFAANIHWVLLISGVIICIIAGMSSGFFAKLGENHQIGTMDSI